MARILYTGPLNPSGTCFSRLKALQRLEPHVYPFDSDPFFENASRVLKIAAIGPAFKKANEALLAACEKNSVDLLWVDKGFWIWPSTLQTLREKGIFLVEHNTDALTPHNKLYRFSYRFLRATSTLFHVYLTTNRPDFKRLSEGSAPTPIFTNLGYDDTRFDNGAIPSEIAEKWQSDLLFVGHYEPRTERGIIALIEAGLSPTVYGYGWHWARRKNQINGYVKFRILSDQEYVYALKSAKICLCFVSEWNHNETSGRSFEIPACGSFMLAMRTPQHIQCFTEGKEAEFFESFEELVSKARYYLSHPDERNEIAKLGSERCLSSGYSWFKIMERDWNKVLQLYNDFQGEVGSPPFLRVQHE